MKKLKTWVFLIIFNGLVMILGFVGFTYINVKELKNTAINQTFSNMRIFSESISSLLTNWVNTWALCHDVENEKWQDSVDGFLKKIAHTNNAFRITLINNKGVVIGDSDALDLKSLDNYIHKSDIIETLNGNKSTSIQKSNLINEFLLNYSVPIDFHGEPYVLRLSIPKKSIVYFSTNAKSTLILSGLIILILVLIITSKICLSVIKGIKELEKASKEYKKGNFEYDLNIKNIKEIIDLAHSFESMAQAIKEDREKLWQLEKIRKDFVANVSHELKTPITSIKGFAETLLDGAIDDQETAINFINIINKESGRLFAIIEDLLDLSRLEQENEAINCVEINLGDFLSDICKKYNVKLILEVEDVNVFINPGIFTQAINNLIENAIKYGGKKSEIECILGKDNTIVVQDKGLGIPIESRDRIFERFYRIDKGRSRSHGGTGLGLAIVRHIITLHGFTIQETGRLDGLSGCRFVIKLK